MYAPSALTAPILDRDDYKRFAYALEGVWEPIEGGRQPAPVAKQEWRERTAEALAGNDAGWGGELPLAGRRSLTAEEQAVAYYWTFWERGNCSKLDPPMDTVYFHALVREGYEDVRSDLITAIIRAEWGHAAHRALEFGVQRLLTYSAQAEGEFYHRHQWFYAVVSSLWGAAGHPDYCEPGLGLGRDVTYEADVPDAVAALWEWAAEEGLDVPKGALSALDDVGVPVEREWEIDRALHCTDETRLAKHLAARLIGQLDRERDLNEETGRRACRAVWTAARRAPAEPSRSFLLD